MLSCVPGMVLPCQSPSLYKSEHLIRPSICLRICSSQQPRSLVGTHQAHGRSNSQRYVLHLLTRHRLENLIYLRINALNLAREHSLFPGPSLSRILRLQNIRPCSVSQLIRLVDHFPLHSFLLEFTPDNRLNSEHRGQILPPPRPVLLVYLALMLYPGVSMFINWYFCKGEVLRVLRLLWPLLDGSDLHSHLDGVQSLIGRCAHTLVSLSVYFPKRMESEGSADACTP